MRVTRKKKAQPAPQQPGPVSRVAIARTIVPRIVVLSSAEIPNVVSVQSLGVLS